MIEFYWAKQRETSFMREKFSKNGNCVPKMLWAILILDEKARNHDFEFNWFHGIMPIEFLF